MKVLLTSASFAPAYGGPAVSVRSLAQQLAAGGLSVAIWAPDGSADQRPTAKSQVTVDDGRLRELSGPLTVALSEFGTPDLFHDSGLWWRHNRQIAAIAICAAKPLVVSVRGMLEPAAMAHRPWKKRIAWHLYQRKILSGAAALHVTSDLEARHVDAFGLGPEIVNISNGLAVPAECPSSGVKSSRRMVFLGRLHPIKGLPMLIEAWGRIRPRDWTLDIVGPDEDGHRRELEAQAKALAIDAMVRFADPVQGVAKQQLLADASVFVLPSRSENFGLAAGEALAAGLPVIATRATPWEALEVERCGWHVDTSVAGLEAGLRAALETPSEELVVMGKRGHAFVARTYSWSRVADEMLDLYVRIRTRR